MNSIIHCSHDTQLVILPPTAAAIPHLFLNREVDAFKHNHLLAGMQRLRGSTYLNDGAIQRHELTADGCHALDIDESAWHILILHVGGRVHGCIRILNHPAGSMFDDLWVSNSALVSSPAWSWRLRQAVESQMKRARYEGRLFSEVGGWAVTVERRGTMDALRLALSTFGLLELLGGSRGVATATVRHNSAPVLRRIGLSRLIFNETEVPPYFDPQFGCEMEFLSFDSAHPNAKYKGCVKELMAHLRHVPIIAGVARQPSLIPRPPLHIPPISVQSTAGGFWGATEQKPRLSPDSR